MTERMDEEMIDKTSATGGTDRADTAEELTLDEAAMLGLLVEANAIQRGRSGRITIDGRQWRLRPTSQRQNLKMLNIDFDILYWQEQMKDGTAGRRRAKRLNAKIRRGYAKKAAHKVLGRWLWLVPFVYAFMWRWIYNCSEKVSATINAEESIGENKDFYLANLGSSKRALVLSTMQVGNAVRQLQERKASADDMLEKDALPKKEEGSRSHRPSGRARTMRR